MTEGERVMLMEEANRVRQILIAGLLLGTLLLAFFPVEPQMSTEVIFDDEVT